MTTEQMEAQGNQIVGMINLAHAGDSAASYEIAYDMCRPIAEYSGETADEVYAALLDVAHYRRTEADEA